MMAPLTRNMMRTAVNMPPQKIPIHMVGFRILSLGGQKPFSSWN
jgi:hypothetical protein